MTAKELLKPRFKIIADYPGNDFGKIGTILNRDWTKFLNDDETQSPIWKISDYPHLFRKLNWWEERDVPEMPKKVSSKFTEPNQIYLIEEWDFFYRYVFFHV